MNNILHLLPNEHLRSFLSRVHTMSPFGTFATSAKRVGLANFSASPVTVMSDLDAILMNILNDDNRSIWQMHMHGNVIESFLNEREKRELPLFLKGKPYDIDFTQSQTVHNRFWRYCKDCISEDLDTVGISYFHQQHQLQGVFHCYKHGTRLINSCSSCTYTVKNLSRMQTPALICPSCGSSMTSQGAYYDETMLKVEQLMLALNDQTLTLCLESVQQNTLAHIGFTLEQTETLAFKKACGDWYKEIFVTLGKGALEQYFSNTRKVNDHIISPTMRTTRLFLSTSTNRFSPPLIYILMLVATGQL
ncbi:TniQ family protein [Vibrio alginolyticus]|uniref:TniQ family protein n=1 Tax=Vibrio alginolyticus TaxID=663 RepID=UPI0011107B32|nr:TniQ family protein [Vibrio alginolyticus]TMX49927.1 hypothetical protein DA091_20310 [Vibrio alginolyticus]